MWYEWFSLTAALKVKVFGCEKKGKGLHLGQHLNVGRVDAADFAFAKIAVQCPCLCPCFALLRHSQHPLTTGFRA